MTRRPTLDMTLSRLNRIGAAYRQALLDYTRRPLPSVKLRLVSSQLDYKRAHDLYMRLVRPK